jgi:hypothetical protein
LLAEVEDDPECVPVADLDRSSSPEDGDTDLLAKTAKERLAVRRGSGLGDVVL